MLAAAAVMCVSAVGGVFPSEFELTADAASVSYPVQEFRIGIGDTNRNVNISGYSDGDYLNSWTTNGEKNEKWTLNYISDGVYEIVNSATGYVITNSNGTAVLSPDVDGANQRWNISGVQTDHEGYYLYYKIVSNADSSVGLTFNQNSNSVSVEPYTGDIYQKFKLNLDGMEGFAANCMVSEGEKAGTIGGLLGETVVVTNKDDLITALNSTEPMTIVVNGNFDMQSDWHTRIRDYKTIVGSYSANTLQDCYLRTNNEYGTEGDEPSDNIVIRNINFQAVNVSNRILINIWSSRNIWIDHCSFTSSLTYDRTGNGQDEVGKFIWINTPYDSYMDAKDRLRSPDYITISYCTFNNRYWTVAYGTQNDETTRCRTTLCYNKWDKNVRRCPQIGNGNGHIYNNYYEGYDSGNGSGTSQIIGGDGSNIVSENCRFQSYQNLYQQCYSAGGGTDPYRDSGSYYSTLSSSTPEKVSLSIKVTSTWYPNLSNYGYSLVDAYNTNGTDAKDFCNAYAGCFNSADKLKYITDSDMAKYVSVKYASPFLKSIEVGSDPVENVKTGAVMDTSHAYMFRNVNSGLYLEVAGGVAANGTDVQQGSDAASNGWTLEDAGNGYYRIYSSLGDGRTYLMDVANGSENNGTNIGIWSDTACDAQLFKFVLNDDGSYNITTKATSDSSCLGVAAGSLETGTTVVQWECNGSDDQKWIAEIKVYPINGTLINNLVVKDLSAYNFWSVKSGISVGDLVFGDRDFTYTSLPSKVIGAEAILTACDSKYSSSDLASFDAAEDITVYVALDSRVEAVPEWLSGWNRTALTAKSSNDVEFVLYSMDFAAGETVTLGANGQSSSCVNYTVFVMEDETEIITTTTTTTEPPSHIIYGDANDNGTVEIADAVYILQGIADPSNSEYKRTEQGEKNADCRNVGNGVDAEDALAIQQYKAEIIQTLPIE